MKEKLTNECINVRRFIEEWGEFPNDLTGACAIASYILMKKFNQYGMRDVVFFQGTFSDDSPLIGGHCWLRVGQWCVDVTATQFNHALEENFPAVWITSPKEYRYRLAGYVSHLERGRRALSIVNNSWGDQSPVWWSDVVNDYLQGHHEYR